MAKVLRGGAVALACFGLLIPRFALASEPTGRAVVDVALRDGGVLSGQVVNAQNVALANREVRVLQNAQEIAGAKTDAEGRFAIEGLRGGVYQVVTAQGSGVYRLWAPQTAPPSAEPAVLLVGGDVVRGQEGLVYFLSSPWVVAGLITAAILTPLAMDNGSTS